VKISSLAFIILYIIAATCNAYTLEVCKYASDRTNKTLPYRKDRVTVVRTTGCIAGNEKPIFVYVYDIDIPLDIAQKINYNKDIKPDVLNTFCTDPDIRSTLNAFDIDTRYYSRNGSFAGSFKMTSKECR
jgi:hypothetical protein